MDRVSVEVAEHGVRVHQLVEGVHVRVLDHAVLLHELLDHVLVELPRPWFDGALPPPPHERLVVEEADMPLLRCRRWPWSRR